MISVADALARLAEHRPNPGSETIAIEDALDRRLAAPLTALRTHPPAAMSAMDGYAVRLDDVRDPGAVLRVIGEAPAGHPFEDALSVGEAVRIFTGSVIPDGADHVVIQENATRKGDQITSTQGYSQSAHIRAAGIDFRDGDLIAAPGNRLTAEHLAIAAASNNASVTVARKLRVGLFSNGDELRPPGSVLGPGEIINSNPYGLAALIKTWGGEPVNLGIARDSVDAIHAVLDQDDTIDLFVPIGGASVGDHDHMRAAFAARGYSPVFEKIAVRPGKPTWFSKSADTLVLGLPGNPASAMVCAHLFLAALLGETWDKRTVTARLTREIGANGPREHFMRAEIELDGAGQLMVSPAPSQDSSLLRPFVTCNALLRRPPKAEAVGTGHLAEVILIRPVV